MRSTRRTDTGEVPFFSRLKREHVISSNSDLLKLLKTTQILKPVGVAAPTMTRDTVTFQILLDSSSLLLKLFWLLDQLDVAPELLFCPLQ